jgi:hypothetical protein
MLLLIPVAVFFNQPSCKSIFEGVVVGCIHVIEATAVRLDRWCLDICKLVGFSIQPRARFHFGILLVEAFSV